MIALLGESMTEPAGIGEYTRNIQSRLHQDVITENLHKFPIKHLWYPYIIRKLDHELIHNPAQYPTFFKPKNKYVITVHDLVPITHPHFHRYPLRFVYTWYKKTLSTADHIITPSEFTKSEIKRLYGFENITVIHNGIDPIQIYNKYEDRPHNITFIGTIEPRKNVDELRGGSRLGGYREL